MAWIMSLNKNNALENMMRYLRECLLSAERGFFSWSLELGVRPLRVVATHREATKPSDREAELESGIGGF